MWKLVTDGGLPLGNAMSCETALFGGIVQHGPAKSPYAGVSLKKELVAGLSAPDELVALGSLARPGLPLRMHYCDHVL